MVPDQCLDISLLFVLANLSSTSSFLDSSAESEMMKVVQLNCKVFKNYISYRSLLLKHTEFR